MQILAFSLERAVAVRISLQTGVGRMTPTVQ